MALINCPECNNQISDRAVSCPKCGVPINQTPSHPGEQDTLYDIKFCGFNSHHLYTKNRFKAFGYIQKITNRYRPEAEYINKNSEYVIFKGLSLSSADIVKKYLDSLGCNIEVYPSGDNTISQFEYSILSSTTLQCPHCHSTAITTGTKGYGFIRGFIGSNKTVNRCGSCGYSWEP